jgi:hypothetical protein
MGCAGSALRSRRWARHTGLERASDPRENRARNAHMGRSCTHTFGVRGNVSAARSRPNREEHEVWFSGIFVAVGRAR